MSFNINQANNVHNHKYNYSLVDFKNVDTKVIIICPIHGEFYQTPYHHISRKQGCNKCKGKRISESQRLTTDEFINKAILIHGLKYDYSKVNYICAHIKVIIICLKHGEFIQTPNNHLYIKNGCPSCGYNTSKTANSWLDSLNIPKTCREQIIKINNKNYKVDAFIKETNTIYEYFGYFWHGHPLKFNQEDINPKNKQKFGFLYKKTLERINIFHQNNYNLVYQWGK